jgi:hypothetical protein
MHIDKQREEKQYICSQNVLDIIIIDLVFPPLDAALRP